ncbi:hypothetical protein GQ457_08G032160 [Hibiscus cannabinus]
MKSIALVEASCEKVKAGWEERLTIIFSDIYIKEILNGNRSDTDFKKEVWIKIVKNFENEMVVFEAQRFKSACIDPAVEEKLDQMFRGIHGDNEIFDKIGKENAMNDIHVSNQVRYNENNDSFGIQYKPIHMQQKRKTTETKTSNLEIIKNLQSKLKELQGCLCRLIIYVEVDKKIHATSNLTLVIDSFGIPQGIKMFDELTNEISKTSHLYFFYTESNKKIKRIELCFYQFIPILEFDG